MLLREESCVQYLKSLFAMMPDIVRESLPTLKLVPSTIGLAITGHKQR